MSATDRSRSACRALTALTTLAAVTSAGYGAGGPPSPEAERSLDAFVEESELVFRGVVSDIEYVLSEPTGPEQARVPYTFVTYRVDDVLQGADPGVHATLRFIGGLDLETLRYLAASHVPQFDLGDEDILFVKGNTRSMCPLVRHERGRLRVIDDQVYSETGRAVFVGEDGRIRLGDRFRLEEVRTTNVLGQVLERGLGANVVDGPSDAMAADELVRAIEERAIAGPSRPFADADPALPFAGPDMTPAAPPAEPDDDGAAEDPSVERERRTAQREAFVPARPAREEK